MGDITINGEVYNPMTGNRWKDDYAAIRQERDELLGLIYSDSGKTAFSEVHLDGRNQHGTHVLLMPLGNLGSLESDAEEQLDADADERLSERIMTDAEAVGFAIGQCVIIDWKVVPDGEYGLDPYLEYVGVNVPVTKLLHAKAITNAEAGE